MRPYLVLTAVVLMAVSAFGQQPFPSPNPCFSGCGPFIPLVTTPMVSLQTASPNPVGATNATTGLVAGATNGTLSQLQGSTSSVYTVPVWYQGGGAPVMTQQVNLAPELLGREGRVVRPMRDEHMRDERSSKDSKEEARVWTYITGREHTSNAPLTGNEAKGNRQAGHVYSNDDVMRQNDANGTVKHAGKTEKM